MAQGQMARELQLDRELVFTVRRDAPLRLTRGQVRSRLCRQLPQTGSPAGACPAPRCNLARDIRCNVLCHAMMLHQPWTTETKCTQAVISR